MTYTTTKVMFEELTKKVNRIFKKLDAIGANHRFEVVRTFVKEVPVYAVDEENRTHHVEDTRVECVEYILEFDRYVVGNYRVGAVVEATLDENENMIYCVDDTTDFLTYRNVRLHCDHCNTNHNRRKTVVLVDNETGAHKMVGLGCLKDFIGYNVEQFAKYFKEIEEIVLQPLEIRDTEMHRYNRCVNIVDYLASCVHAVRKFGYTKETKFDAIDIMKTRNGFTEEDVATAHTIIEFFEGYEPQDSFETNIRNYVTERMPVTNANGFVAYAYVQYTKIQDRIKKAAEQAANAQISNHVGNIGDKITFKATIKCVTGYSTQFGYTFIYRIEDENKNVYIWKTGTDIDPTDDMVIIRGTVKEHNEYRGEKQTVLTRCKVVA